MLSIENNRFVSKNFEVLFTKNVCYKICKKPEDVWFYWIRNKHISALFSSIWIGDKQALYKWIIKNAVEFVAAETETPGLTEEEMHILSGRMKKELLSEYLDEKWVNMIMDIWEKSEHNISTVLSSLNVYPVSVLKVLS